MVKIQCQTGLGDLINALPTVEKAVELGQGVIVATNHAYALEPFGDAVQTVAVRIDGDGVPVLNPDFIVVRYDRYGPDSYEKRYFATVFPESNYDIHVSNVRERYRNFYCAASPEAQGKYVVFAPPRAAERHKNKNSAFECAPNIEASLDVIKRIAKTLPITLVGKNDKYPDALEIPPATFDLRDKTTFPELCALIERSVAVVSQVSAITSIAGLFGKPTRFLPAAAESILTHKKHVLAVVWPGQAIL